MKYSLEEGEIVPGVDTHLDIHVGAVLNHSGKLLEPIHSRYLYKAIRTFMTGHQDLVFLPSQA